MILTHPRCECTAALAALLALCGAGCSDAPDPRAWMAAALFIQREAPGGVVAIDTTAGNLPESARDLLETNTIILADTGRAVLRFGEVRAAGGGTYDIDAELRLDTVTRHLRFIVECQSRHCLVMDTTTIESSTRSN